MTGIPFSWVPMPLPTHPIDTSTGAVKQTSRAAMHNGRVIIGPRVVSRSNNPTLFELEAKSK